MKKNNPYLIILLGFVAVSFVGALLLMLPISRVDGYNASFIDELFTAVSAVCVTGLTSVQSIDTSYTFFGQFVIILLEEIGGLGFITIVMFLFSLMGLKIGIADRFLIKESMNQNSASGMVKLVRSTVKITLIVQLIGAVLNFIVFIGDFNFFESLWLSIFHSITAFNNAGFSILSEAQLQYYNSNIFYVLITSILIFIGGIGFVVIYDVIHVKSWRKLRIHSKIVLKTSFVLIVVGTLIFKISEWNQITWLEAFFTSVNLRTAGFFGINYNMLSFLGYMIALAFMFIGGSPASTAGGVKVTTFYTLVKSIASFATGKRTLTYNRQISNYSITKAFVLVMFSITVIFMGVSIISIIERFNSGAEEGYGYLTKIVFEVFSAFSNTGASMGITPGLHSVSKIVIIFIMLFGRLGPISIIKMWSTRWNNESNNKIKYIEEKMLIG